MEWIVEAECREDLVDGHWFGGEEPVRCKDCKWFADSVPYWELPLLMMNHVCTKWGRGCRTDLDGFCFMGERKDDDET